MKTAKTTKKFVAAGLGLLTLVAGLALGPVAPASALGAQTITFVNPGNQVKTTTDQTFLVSATTEYFEFLDVTLVSQTPSICSVPGTSSPFTVIMLGDVTNLGTCTLYATQPGDSDFAAATPVQQSFQITGSTPATYSVNLDLQDGSSATTQTVTSGQNAVLPSVDPTRVGYTFAGWALSSSGSAVALPFTPTADATLFALWSPILYTVSYNLNSGTGSALPFTQANPLDFVTVPRFGVSRVGYTFGGWSLVRDSGVSVGGGFIPTGNVTVYAIWTAVTNTVTFDSQGGSVVASVNVALGGNLTWPSDPTKASSTFVGWNSAADGTGTSYTSSSVLAINAATTLFAVWAPSGDVSFTFDSQGGTVIPPVSVRVGHDLGWPTVPSRAGYTFLGWSRTISGVIVNSMTVTTERVMYAVWSQDGATVSFNSEGGSAVESMSVPFGTNIVWPADPTRDGYSFDGWATSEGGSVLVTLNVTDSTTLYAVWTEDLPISFFFDPQGGNVIAPQLVQVGHDLRWPTVPFRAGYTFLGWSRTTDGEVVSSMTVTTERIMYEIWAIDSYTVSFNSEGGSAVTSMSVNYATDIVWPAAPIRRGYTFLGWAHSADGTVLPTLNVTEGQTLYALWHANIAFISPVVYHTGASAVLDKKSVQALTKLVSQLKGKTGLTVKVESWALKSAGSTKAQDKALSQARADAVAKFLRSHGVKGKISAVGKGRAIENSQLARRSNITASFNNK